MSETILVPEARRGPPSSGNGGYVAGVLAELLRRGVGGAAPDEAVEVTLRAPIRLDVPLEVRPDGQQVSLHDGEVLVAVGVPAVLELDVPAPPTFDEALAVRGESWSLQPSLHPQLPGERTGLHPICFCCGGELGPEEGLHVYSAPLPGRDAVASAWRCPAIFADVAGQLPEPVLWTALDCPGQFAWVPREGAAAALLGRITGRVDRRPAADEPLVVLGWPLRADGRKRFAGTAVYDGDGRCCARAMATWITIVEPPT